MNQSKRPAIIDLNIFIGKRYGTRVVVRAYRNARGNIFCIMACDCGTTSNVKYSNLKKGNSLTCRRCAYRTIQDSSHQSEIKALFKSGTSVRDIALHFNISRQRVYQIVGKVPSKPKQPRKARSRSRCLALPILCKMDDCTNTAKCRGFCHTHYLRWMYHNSADRRKSLRTAQLAYVKRIKDNRLVDPEKYARHLDIQRRAGAKYYRKKKKLETGSLRKETF